MAGMGLVEFISVMIPSLVVALIMYIIFCICRSKFEEVYASRTTNAMRGVEWEQETQKLPVGFLAWLAPLLKIPLKDVAEKSGTDAAGYVAFQRMMCLIFAVLVVLSWIVLFPVYLTGEQDLDGFDRVTMSNVEQSSDRLWAAAAVMWVASAVVYFLFYKTTKEVASVAAAEETRAVRYWHHTLLVSGIPEESRTAEGISSYFEGLYPGQVSHAQPVKHLGKAYEKSFAKYVNAWRSLKKAELALQTTPDKTPMTRTFPCCGKKVEAIPYFQGQCSELRAELEKGRAEYDGIPATPGAFVTFKTIPAAQEAQAKNKGAAQWRCEAAPEPRDIVWSSLLKGRSRGVRMALILLVILLVTVVTVFWAIPVAFTQSLANLEALSKYEFLAWVQDLPPSVLGIVQGLLPTVALAVLNALVIPVFALLSEMAGIQRFRGLHSAVMCEYFGFLAVNAFFVVLVSGSLFNQLKEITDDPAKLPELLGNSVPKVATFFILFLTLRALAGAPGRLACLGPLIVSRIKLKFLAKTDFEKREALVPAFPPLGVMYANDLLVFLIAISYTVISPVLLVFAWLYFALNLVTGKYLLGFHHRTQYQSRDILMFGALKLACVALIFGQLVGASVLAIKGSFAAVVCYPLPVVTLGLRCYLPRGPGRDLAQSLTEETAAELGKGGPPNLLGEAREQGWWMQPSYTADLEDPVADRFLWAGAGEGAAKV